MYGSGHSCNLCSDAGRTVLVPFTFPVAVPAAGELCCSVREVVGWQKSRTPLDSWQLADLASNISAQGGQGPFGESPEEATKLISRRSPSAVRTG